MADKIVLGFSGGVDSAVSAMLLREQGFSVHCMFLYTGGTEKAEQTAETAAQMGFDFSFKDVRAELEELVCKPFAEEYLSGRTPNPCIICNPRMKFQSLLEEADRQGAPYIATGHYARAKNGALYMGAAQNDQSYMLCRIRPEQLKRLILPLGDYDKKTVRMLASSYNLPVATKADSMEICFIPSGDHAAWIERRGESPKRGRIIFEGRQVGTHDGIHRYTLGQRRGLKISCGERVYVSKIDAETGDVTLSAGDELMASELLAEDMNWLTAVPEPGTACSVRIRHSQALFPAKVFPEGEDAVIKFNSPVRAPTAGQSAAVYSGERLIGGGFIKSSDRA